VSVNDVLSAYAATDAPFGGVRESGFGRVHGEEGLRSMCELRHVNHDRVPVGPREPFWYPYGERTYRTALKGLRALFRTRSPLRRVLDLF
jgi:succinate-semialdehyde dehydrogenase/glutarate-semialdehyde dehydrogenase